MLTANEQQSTIGILMWNVHGFKKERTEIFREKSDPIVKKIFDENELICISDSWRDKFDSDILNWDDNFTEISHLGNRQSGRALGGTSMFIKNDPKHMEILNTIMLIRYGLN